MPATGSGFSESVPIIQASNMLHVERDNFFLCQSEIILRYCYDQQSSLTGSQDFKYFSLSYFMNQSSVHISGTFLRCAAIRRRRVSINILLLPCSLFPIKVYCYAGSLNELPPFSQYRHQPRQHVASAKGISMIKLTLYIL